MNTGKYGYRVTLTDDQVFNVRSDKTLDEYKQYLASGIGEIVTGEANVHISARNLKYVEKVADDEPLHFPASGTGAYQEGDRLR